MVSKCHHPWTSNLVPFLGKVLRYDVKAYSNIIVTLVLAVCVLGNVIGPVVVGVVVFVVVIVVV